MSKSYIDICKNLDNNLDLLSIEKAAIRRLIADAIKWRRYKKRTTVNAPDMMEVISYYLDKKSILLERRPSYLTRLRKPAKELLNKCNKDVKVCKYVIDSIETSMSELNWGLEACVNHCGRYI